MSLIQAQESLFLAKLTKCRLKIFCQHEPGDFPQNLLESVPFHTFLDEWDRRRASEQNKGSQKTFEAILSPTGANATNSDPNPIESVLQSHRDIFMGNVHFNHLSASLESDFGETPFESIFRLSSGPNPAKKPPARFKPMEKGRMWIGNANHVSHLHFDAHHGLLVTLHGHKRATVYEPITHLGIIEKSKGNHAAHNPLEKSLPESSKPLVADLHEGDALFIPVYWWHLVESVSSSIAINFWSYPDLEASKSKFGKLWPFTRILCIDHIKAKLGANSSDPIAHKPSKWSLLTQKNTMEIVEATLRFKVEQVSQISDHSDEKSVSNINHADEDEKRCDTTQKEGKNEMEEISTWDELVEFACAKVKRMITEETF